MAYEKLPTPMLEYELPDSGLTIAERKAFGIVLEAVVAINRIVIEGEVAWRALPEQSRKAITTNAVEMQEGLERAVREGKLKRKRLN